MSRILIIAFTLLGLISVPRAFAEGEETRAVGQVTAKSATAITVVTSDKKAPPQTFVVNDKTEVRRDRNPISIEAVNVGETAGVVGLKENGQLVATLIQVRAAAKP